MYNEKKRKRRSLENIVLGCNLCSETFDTTATCNKHKYKHAKQYIQCQQCDQTPSSNIELEAHSSACSGNVVEKVEISIDWRMEYVCSICLNRFAERKSLTDHILTHQITKAEALECSLCGEDFRTMDELNIHIDACFPLKEGSRAIKGYQLTESACIDCQMKDEIIKNFVIKLKDLQQKYKDNTELMKDIDVILIKSENPPNFVMVENENIKAEIEGDDLIDDYTTDDYEIADNNHKRKKLRKTPNVDKTILCSNCVDLEFSSLREFNEHKKTIHIKCKVLYKCNLCEKKMDPSNFSRHKKWHAGSYSCDICHLSYAENKSLQKHIRKLHSEIEFYPSTNIIEECCVIKEEIDNEDFNIDHDNTNENTIANNLRSFKLKAPNTEVERFLACNLCKQIFIDFEHFNEHKNTHKHKVLTCNKEGCSQSFEGEDQVEIHNQTCTGIVYLKDKWTDDKKCCALYVCALCYKIFNASSNYIRHKQQHLEEAFQCDLCNKSFFTNVELKKHKSIFHLSKEVNQTESKEKVETQDISENKDISNQTPSDVLNSINEERKNVPLSNAGDTLNKSTNKVVTDNTSEDVINAQTLIKNKGVKVNSNEKNTNISFSEEKESNDESVCKICHKKYFDKYTMIRHLEKHGVQYNYPCSECDATFRRKIELSKHKIIHTGGTLHQCDLCEETFTKLFSLEQHLIKHRGETPYSCDQCEEKFSTKKRLYGHKKLHISADAYSCDVCQATFAKLQQLKIHMMEHKEKKKFACTQCPFSFAIRTQLDRHLLTHSGEKPHVCHLCGKCFAKKDAVTKHIASIHPDC